MIPKLAQKDCFPDDRIRSSKEQKRSCPQDRHFPIPSVPVCPTLEQLGDPMPKRYTTERKLRLIVKMSNKRQRTMIENIR